MLRAAGLHWQNKIEKEPREATVYNFEVADFNSYFVSNLGVWVHNCSILKWTNSRVEHVKLHGTNDLQKIHHGGFYGKPVSVVNQAWVKKGNVRPIAQGNRDFTTFRMQTQATRAVMLDRDKI